MTGKTLAEIMSWLEAKWEMCRGKEMSGNVDTLYRMALKPLDDDVARAAVCKALLHKPAFPPDVGELLSLAAQIASPVLNPGDAWAEFWRAVELSVDRPDWSHPLIEETVRRLGGWGDQFTHMWPHLSEVDLRGIWFARFAEAYEAAAREWTGQVVEQLRLPAGQRDPRYRLTAPPTLRIEAAS